MYWDDVLKEVPLPPGNWEVIGLAKDYTEEAAKKIISILPVHDVLTGRKYVCFDAIRGEYTTISATEALASLLKYKGLSESNTLILIKQ